MVFNSLSKKHSPRKQKRLDEGTVRHIHQALISTLDTKQAVNQALEVLKGTLESELITLTLLDGRGENPRSLLANQTLFLQGRGGFLSLSSQKSTFHQVVETGRPLILPRLHADDLWFYPGPCEDGMQSSLFFPLKVQGKVIGTLNLASSRSDFFSGEHIRFLEKLGPALTVSIQRIVLQEETSQKLDEITIFYEMMKIATSNVTLDQILSETTKSLKGFFRSGVFGILLLEENTKKLIPHPSYVGISAREIEALDLTLGRGIKGWVAQTGEPLLIEDVTLDRRYVGPPGRAWSEMCVPLKAGGKIIGVMDAQRPREEAFNRESLHLLTRIGEHLATLIEAARSEERYRSVVESALDGVLVMDENSQLIYVNERLAELLGSSREELLGRGFRDFVEEENKEGTTDPTTGWRSRTGGAGPCEIRLIRKDGAIRNAEMSSTVIKDSEGNTNTISFIKDVTERRRMEEQLFQAEKLRAVGEMASGVAHDFNNALAIILGNAQLLLLNPQDQETRETLRIIEQVAKDSAQTVRRLQEFTRNKISRELFSLDVNAIVRDAVQITKPMWKDGAQNKGLRMEMVCDFGEIPPSAGNVSELKEVVMNMIFNAVEAMPRGGQIRLRTFRRKEKICIEIADTGVGMDEDVKRKVFEPFFTTKSFSNSGLGLSMAYGIIKRFGGDIEVESKLGKGTTFTITLPAEPGVREAASSSPSFPPGREGNILVIDDEELVRVVLADILTHKKHRVTLARNGEEGLRLFREEKFDMVLTDLGMPGMSGWEVCREIKKMDPDTPVGMITGWGMEVDEEKRKENGIRFILSKPFDFHQILNVIDSAWNSPG